MRYANKKTRDKGAALLIVLLIVAAITIISLGFIVRGDTELACGQNMDLKANMDYLAESGLEHAKGLIMYPQDINFTGATGQQLYTGSDYYDVSVTKLSECNWQITSSAYRKAGSVKTAQSSFTAQLRLNPCIVYWQSVLANIPAGVVIGGDAYFGDIVNNYGNIKGDVYSAKTITSLLTGQIQGQVYPNTAQAPIALPGILPANYNSTYYIGGNSYSVGPLGTSYNGLTLTTSGSNPAGVYYCSGSLTLKGTVNITGTLVVNGDLTLQGGANVTIQPVNNFPALIISGKIDFQSAGCKLTATGYTQVGNYIDMENKSGTITINGALYILNGGIQNTLLTNGVTVTGMPQKASLAIWSSGGNLVRWSPAAGAFYKSITRNP
jgi:cytoskeletal protein CcmA (bactofilin family)